MKKITIAMIGMLLLCIMPLSALNISQYELTLQDTFEDGDITFYQVADRNGFVFTIGSDETITDEDFGTLAGLKDSLGELKHIADPEVRIIRKDGTVQIFVMPGKLRYQGRDMIPYIPGGMLFYAAENLEYNFRIRVNKLFLRINGVYISEERLLERMNWVIDHSIEYLQSQDPEFLLESLNILNAEIKAFREENDAYIAEQEAVIAALQKDVREADESLENRGAQLAGDLQRKYDGMIATQSAALETALQQSASAAETDRAAIRDEIQQKLDAQAESLEALRGDLTALADSVEKLTNAVMVIGNRSLFGGVREYNTVGIARLLEIKAENPAMTQKEAAAILKEEGVKISKTEIFLVFAVFYNEYIDPKE